MKAAQSGLRSFAAVGHRNVEKLAQIDAVLMRLVDGRYGVCFASGGSIAIERLRLLPATLLCLRCARRRPRVSCIWIPAEARRRAALGVVGLLATANPAGLIASSGMKVYGEASGSSKVEGRAKGTVKEIVEMLKQRFQEQGWIY